MSKFLGNALNKRFTSISFKIQELVLSILLNNNSNMRRLWDRVIEYKYYLDNNTEMDIIYTLKALSSIQKSFSLSEILNCKEVFSAFDLPSAKLEGTTSPTQLLQHHYLKRETSSDPLSCFHVFSLIPSKGMQALGSILLISATYPVTTHIR